MNTGFGGKTVIVTGGSGGIGRQIVRDFIAEGANVVLHYFRGKERALELTKEIDHANLTTIQADLRNEAEVQSLIDQTRNQFGGVDVLIANAGVWPSENRPIHEMSLERWRGTMDSNLTSTFLCVREFMKSAVAGKLEAPSVVVIGSTAGFVGEANHADYASAKSGLMYGMVQSLKNEIARVAPLGRINAVCPGWTLTPMAKSVTGKEAEMVRVLQTIPLRKFGKPKDVSNAVLFLASNELAGHVTGETLFVRGGMEGRVLYEKNEIDLSKAL